MILWVQGQPGLQSEFQDIQGHTEKPCLGVGEVNLQMKCKIHVDQVNKMGCEHPQHKGTLVFVVHMFQ